MNTESKTAYEGWSIVEIMGHNTIAGYVSEQSIAGVAMLRVDVPGTEAQPAYTKFYGGTAIYAITPTTEEIAKVAAQRLAVRPVDSWVVPDPRPRLVDSSSKEPSYLDQYGEDDDHGDYDDKEVDF